MSPDPFHLFPPLLSHPRNCFSSLLSPGWWPMWRPQTPHLGRCLTLPCLLSSAKQKQWDQQGWGPPCLRSSPACVYFLVFFLLWCNPKFRSFCLHKREMLKVQKPPLVHWTKAIPQSLGVLKAVYHICNKSLLLLQISSCCKKIINKNIWEADDSLQPWYIRQGLNTGNCTDLYFVPLCLAAEIFENHKEIKNLPKGVQNLMFSPADVLSQHEPALGSSSEDKKAHNDLENRYEKGPGRLWILFPSVSCTASPALGLCRCLGDP